MASINMASPRKRGHEQEVEFDPADHQQDPERALMLAVRTLRVGARIRLPNGTVVKSVTRKGSYGLERAFAVIPPEDQSTAIDRHRAVVLGHGVHPTATHAARAALKE